MALNLSTLTSPATSGDVLAEALTTADFLENVPVLRNLARGSQKGGDAKQDVALNQPKALPLIKNPAGDLGGYLYIPDVAGNYATGPSVTIGSNETWEGELDMVITNFPPNSRYIRPLGGGGWNTGFGLIFYDEPNYGGYVRVISKSVGASQTDAGIPLGTPFNIKYGYDGSDLYVDLDDVRVKTNAAPDQSGSITVDIQLGQQGGIVHAGNYAIQKAKLTVNSSVVFDCDFNGSTSIRHGDTKFNCVGGPVSLTRTGNDPVTVVKKDILRFANTGSTNIAMKGLFANHIDSGYMFAAFSVLGNGGENYGRIFSVNKTGASSDSSGDNGIFSSRQFQTNDLRSYYGGNLNYHAGLFDDANGDILHEVKLKSGDSSSKVNNADSQSSAVTISIDSNEFNISQNDNNVRNGGENPSLDLEFLALFSADSVPDEATASKIRDYINKRNQIYLRHQTDGFFFFDPQKLAAGDVTSWNGNITGSDLGDTDVATNVTIVQGSQTSQPNADGYSLTFEDNTQHLEWASAYTPNFPAGQTKAWQIVGTSLGTFAYLTQGSVTELNLLGNLGHANTRQTGDLYGIILLPESATGADIESARKLLIDRGSSDALSATVLYTYWYQRADIVHFENVDMSSAVNVQNTWDGCSNMVTFEVTEIPNCTNFSSAWKGTTALTSFPADAKLGTEETNVSFFAAWNASGLNSFSTPLPTAGSCTDAFRNCTSLSDFRTTDIKNCSDFTSAWRNCSALTSFSAGAKLGTEATNVNFSSAWLSSGLTSFSTPLPTATNLRSSFEDAVSLVSFNSQLPLATNALFAWDNCSSLTSFDVSLPSLTAMYRAWAGCSSLTDFSADVFSNWNPQSISSGVFDFTWQGCTALTAQSVENILTSIAASGKYATSTGASGGSALADAGIDIDYNGDPLSAATNSAIDSLSGKGWEVFINGVLVIPNILDLEPAAAYSLRSFDADADPNVVNVRRSSDSATSDFKASEVSDGTLVAFVGAGNDGHVTTWYDQRKIVETGDAYGTTISGTADGSPTTYNQLAPAVAGEFYRVRFTVSNLDPRGRVRYRNYAGSADVAATAGLGSLIYFHANGDYEAYVPSDDGLSLWFYPDSGAGGSFDYSQVSVQQVAEVPNNADQAVASSQPKIVDGGTLVTEGGLPSINFPTEVSHLSLDHSDLYGQATLDSYYVTRADTTLSSNYAYPALVNSTNAYGMVSQPTDAASPTSLFYGSPTYYVNGIQLTSPTRDSISQATSGGQKLVEHIGADTTNAEWQAHDMNFGNLNNNASFGYTGKLQEMILFNTDQSANRAGIENNINDHFDIYS